MEPKRLGLLRELLPNVRFIGVLANSNFPPAVRQVHDIEAAARMLGKRLFVSRVSNDSELSAAISTLIEQRVGALLGRYLPR
jgi:putative tryptophan/tyrosine transport system substrate-binding protein